MTETAYDVEGVGLYRGQQPTIPDNLTPGQPPHPSEGAQGPPISIPLEGYEHTMKLIDELGKRMSLETRPDFVKGTATGQTDGSGNAAISIYRVAAGMEARLHLLTVNANVAATGVPYTPAAPYQSDNAYLELFDADSALELGPSGLVDFLPTIAKVQLLPALFRYSFDQAPFVRGPQEFVLKLSTGPLSVPVTARYQISLKRMKGVA